MLIKKKSVIVTFVSSMLIAVVLILTLVGYAAYTELKTKELELYYHDQLEKINARLYAKYIEISKLDVKIGGTGPLKGKVVLEGAVKNSGTRVISDFLAKISFLDKDGAGIYEVVFHPQEPPLGVSILTQINIPYVSISSSKTTIKPGEALPFKKILTNCPKEILAELKKGGNFSKDAGRWSGRFGSDILAVNFSY